MCCWVQMAKAIVARSPDTVLPAGNQAITLLHIDATYKRAQDRFRIEEL